MHTVILGASRNIGYYSLLNLLAQDGNTVAVLLRSPQAFKDDPAVTPHIASGRLTIEQGDATVAADVAKVINDNTHIDFVISTIGSYPTLTLGGFQLPDPNLCTRAASALVTSLVALKQTPLPRVVAVSSMGIGAEHHIMPFAMRVMYTVLLSSPHADKEGLEYIMARSARGIPTPAASAYPPERILSAADRDGAPQDVLPEVIIVRPALLTDGEVRGKDKTRAANQLSTYTVSRKEIARFIVDECAPGHDDWVNQGVVVGY